MTRSARGSSPLLCGVAAVTSSHATPPLNLSASPRRPLADTPVWPATRQRCFLVQSGRRLLCRASSSVPYRPS